jgi:hypothetical protein
MDKVKGKSQKVKSLEQASQFKMQNSKCKSLERVPGTGELPHWQQLGVGGLSIFLLLNSHAWNKASWCNNPDSEV